MNAAQANPRKPKALTKGSKIAVFAPASPADHQEILTGIAELRRLGFEFSPRRCPRLKATLQVRCKRG